MAGRVTELAERYEKTLPVLEGETVDLENKVKSHLEKMGFAW
jgi:type I restriction enzyme M protein